MTCDTNNPNQLRCCDETGELYQELGAVPRMPFRHEFKFAAASPLPWGLHAGLSILSYAVGSGRQYGAVGASYLTVNWPVPASLFPGGRTQPVTVNLIAPGTKHLERWNQVDVNLKRIVHLRGLEVQPTMEVFNLLNSGWH